VGVQLILDGLRQVLEHPAWTAQGIGHAQLLTAALLILGWLTPFAGPAAAVLVVGLAMSDNRWELHIAQAGIALGLLALGPGAWSIDARLYGRKRIEV
jgi:uncharacterized membrane protein YphA (DoxX/SURF4 family)